MTESSKITSNKGFITLNIGRFLDILEKLVSKPQVEWVIFVKLSNLDVGGFLQTFCLETGTVILQNIAVSFCNT